MFTMEFLFMCLLAFGAYYVGIIIRKIALPGKDSPTLGKQLLLGLPVSLVVVTPLLIILNAAVHGSVSNQISALATLGIIMEHGMVLNETLSKHLQTLTSK